VFVRRYCPPPQWEVLVDIDASEEGRTGSRPVTDEGRARQQQMREAAATAFSELQRLGVSVGGNRADWYRKHGLPQLKGDRDVVAFNAKKRRYLIAEVEGESSGQPEQKLYKAIGQIVMAASERVPDGWKRKLVLVVHGEEISKHMARATALEKLGISAIELVDNKNDGKWLFGGLD
jgi:hypothetical protein